MGGIRIKNEWKVVGDLREFELEDGLNNLVSEGFKIHQICDNYRSESNDLRFTIIARKQSQERSKKTAEFLVELV